MDVTVSASEFKAKCLGLLKRVGNKQLDKVVITHRGKPIAVVGPPTMEVSQNWIDELHGAMCGTVHVAEGVDLTEPVFEGVMEADLGILYR